jgi:quercetin dioxygenase-like cupin family protein
VTTRQWGLPDDLKEKEYHTLLKAEKDRDSLSFYVNTIYLLLHNHKIKLELENTEQEKSKVFIIVEIIEYIPNSVVIKTIIKKTTGNISAVSFDSGESLIGRVSPFDTFIQVIDGAAEIVIDEKSHLLETGQSIIIPAHSSSTIKANVRFKMLSTIIKSGYED